MDVFFGGPGFGCKIKGAEVEVVDFVVQTDEIWSKFRSKFVNYLMNSWI